MLEQCLRIKRIFFVLLLVCFACVPSSVLAADNTDPVTTHATSGIAGNAGWYRSDITVTLTASDNESGPDSTTYWINSGIPTVIDHITQSLPDFNNYSFENGTHSLLTNWNKGFDGAGNPLALFYRSSTGYDGNKSAAIAYIDFDDEFHYWYNDSWAKSFPVGTNVNFSAWGRTVMFSNDYAYFEVWGQQSDGSGDQLLASSNLLGGGNFGWREAVANLTVPALNNYLYVKVGAVGSPAAIVYWDFVRATIAGQQSVNFSFVHTLEGSHTLHYFSDDNANNIESEKTTILKKDTVSPNPWQTFTATGGGCSQCWITDIEVRDSNSGLDVDTTEYRFYTDEGGQLWSNWFSVASVNRVQNNQPASDGETGFVSVTTPEINFGASGTGPFRVQYRVNDVAGNTSTSPVYEIASPWMRTVNGSIFIDGEIAIPPSDVFDNATADVFSGDEITSFVTTPNWLEEDYTHQYAGATELTDIIQNAAELEALALNITGSDLPTTNGIYRHSGNFHIDTSSLPSNYDTADVTALVFIERDLTIGQSYTVPVGNNTVFFVGGDLLVDSDVEDMAGFFIVRGEFDSDPDGTSTVPLEVSGSVIALSGIKLSRDLGNSGGINNNTTPAETFIWQPEMTFDPVLSAYLNNEEKRYIWHEVIKPD